MFPYLFFFQTRAFLLAAGFSLAFGAMFTKTYRVHSIFRRANSGLVRSKVSAMKANFKHTQDQNCSALNCPSTLVVPSLP